MREHRLGRLPDESLPLGGISAICKVSLLQDNPWPTLAATRSQEQALGLNASAASFWADEPDGPACVVRVVRYRLKVADENAIDPLSAILSLSDADGEDPPGCVRGRESDQSGAGRRI